MYEYYQFSFGRDIPFDEFDSGPPGSSISGEMMLDGNT